MAGSGGVILGAVAEGDRRPWCPPLWMFRIVG